MTIKKQLYITNILMVVVPIVVSIVVLAIGAFVTLGLISQQNESFSAQFQFHQFQNALSDRVEDLLTQPNPDKQEAATAKVKALLKDNKAELTIYRGDRFYKELGAGAYMKNNEDLIKTMLSYGGEGSITVGETSLIGQKVMIGGQSYTLFLSSIRTAPDYDRYLALAENIILILIIVVVAAVFFTCRSLARFVIKKIEKPLDILAEGVGQIRDGNLNYRIDYGGQDEFTQICRDFNEMAARLKQSVENTRRNEQSRKELLAGISHDLRTPLTSINAYVEGILEGVAKTPEKQGQYLETIYKKAREINDMVDKLFLFSKLDLGEYPFYPQKLNLRRELEEAVQNNFMEYKEKGLELTLGPAAPNLFIYADASQLSNVFDNIINNSFKYKDKKQGRLTISAEQAGPDAVIRMEDNGPGVPEGDLEKIFETFYRCDPARKDSSQGSGLGLAVSAKSMERMNGSMAAENVENGGLRIILTLPAYKDGE